MASTTSSTFATSELMPVNVLRGASSAGMAGAGGGVSVGTCPPFSGVMHSGVWLHWVIGVEGLREV